MDIQLNLPGIALNWSHFHLQEYVNYFSSLVKTSRGVLRRSDDGAVLACMGNDMWNSILFETLTVTSEQDLNATVTSWENFFASNDVDHYDAYFLSTIPNKDLIENALKEHKFRFWASIYGMELDLTKYTPNTNVPQASDFTIAHVSLSDESNMLKVHSIASKNFLTPAEQDYLPTLVSMRRGALEEPYYLYFLGKHQNEPVATLSISFKYAFAGVAQISDVTTLESHRGRGYASTLIQFALAECKKHGFKYAVLQGEQDGPMKLYARLGFVQSCQIDVWEKPSPEDEASN